MGKYLKKIKSEKQNYHKFYFSLFITNINTLSRNSKH
ncbi:Uncharacterised protein [Capnocytophaga sputigena]|nr:Uncharacterised protein [Capnocytophaga sputigena]